MANPTTNFGWQMPTSTDLVTDLPADFEVFGQAVDTSLVDLKGGTTGQVLSKATNTDMDFTWVTTDDANAIQNSIVDAKGDLISATANDTPARLAVGADGSTLVANSAAATGLSWAMGNAYAAGKNKIINGNFGVWQRGTTFTSPNIFQYTADRWQGVFSGTVTGLVISQQSFALGTAPVAGYEGTFFIRQLCTAQSSGTAFAIAQRVEDVRTFAGQTVTLSFWAKADASRTWTSRLIQSFGSGGSGDATTSGASLSVTTSWQRFTQTFTVPSIAGKTVGAGSYLYVVIDGPINTGQTMDLWGVQLEAGSVATPFQTATGTIQGELAACQRYYWRNTGALTNQTILPNCGSTSSSTTPYFAFQPPVPMRIAPTSIDFANLQAADGVAGYALSSLNINGATQPNAIQINASASGLTTFRPLYINAAANNAFIGFSAEL